MKCACGQPLHYSDPALQEQIQKLVDELGECIDINIGTGTWAVPRHYIALHGIKAAEIPSLGFERVR